MPRRSVCLLAILLVPHLANAEPIGWSYDVTAAPAADYGGKLQFAFDRTSGAYAYPSGQGVDLFLFKAVYDTTPPAGTADTRTEYRYTATVRLRDDDLPGTYAEFVWQGYQWTDWTFYPDVWNAEGTAMEPRLLPTRSEVGFGPADGNELVFLGGHRYRIETYLGFSASETHVHMKVTPWDVAETPEPGTMALAGVGLAGVGLLRLRRRQK